ncbi:hypothetical protein SME38J_05070 [Serratia marcescens]|nr:hypothetical protein SME38J_05070 [Serratia marcescens]
MPHTNLASLKSTLLQPMITAAQVTLFGASVHIRRLTARELMNYDEGLTRARNEGDPTLAARLGANLILSCLVNEAGEHFSDDELPTADELLTAHDNAALFEAIKIIQSHSYGTLDAAEKN